MTDDDAGAAEAGDRRRSLATAGRGLIGRPGAQPARAPVRRPGAQGRRPLPRRARHEDPGPLPRARSSGATTRSCPARSTPRASCATTRSTSGSTPTRSSTTGGASAARRATPTPVIAVPRPIAAPRQGLTFSPSILVVALLTVFVARVRAPTSAIQVLRFAEAADDRGHRPGRRAVIDVDETTTSYTLRGHDACPGPPCRSRARPGSLPGQRRPRWRLDGRRRPPARAETSSTSRAIDPDTGKRSEDTIRAVHHRAVPGDRGADADRRPAGRGHLVRERRHPGRRPRDQRRIRRGQRDLRRTVADRRSSKGRRAPRRRRCPSRSRSQVAEDGSFSTPFELTAGRWSITVTAASPQGKTAAQTRNVTVVYKGVNLVVTIDGGRAWLKVWVDGKLDPELGAAGSVIADGRDAHVHRPGVGRGPLGIVRRDPFHAERHAARCARADRHPRDLAVRATGSAGPDPAPVAPWRTTRCVDARRRAPRCQERVPGAAGDLHGFATGRIVHGRPRRPPDHRDARVRARYYLGGFVTYSDELKRDLVGVPGRRARGARRGVRADGARDGDRRAGPDRARTSARLGHRDRRARWRERRTSPSA